MILTKLLYRTWMYRVWAWSYKVNLNPVPSQTTLCAFFWRTVITVLITSFMALALVVCVIGAIAGLIKLLVTLWPELTSWDLLNSNYWFWSTIIVSIHYCLWLSRSLIGKVFSWSGWYKIWRFVRRVGLTIVGFWPEVDIKKPKVFTRKRRVNGRTERYQVRTKWKISLYDTGWKVARIVWLGYFLTTCWYFQWFGPIGEFVLFGFKAVILVLSFCLSVVIFSSILWAIGALFGTAVSFMKSAVGLNPTEVYDEAQECWIEEEKETPRVYLFMDMVWDFLAAQKAKVCPILPFYLVDCEEDPELEGV